MNYTHDTLTLQGDLNIINNLPEIGLENVQEEIIRGLTSRNKYISPKFFYDHEGSELFEEITGLKEYYPTRTEKSILPDMIGDLSLDLTDLNIIELGSGDPSKINLLLKQIPAHKLDGIKYYPVDISESAIENAAQFLTHAYPKLNITGIVADFMHQMKFLPKLRNRLFCFFGSTLGNLSLAKAVKFIEGLGNEMQPGDSFILGLDMIKDIQVLEKAYNDEKGVTAKFNKNILRVVNRLLNTSIDPDAFEHLAFYNEKQHRIEMHLVASKSMRIPLGDSLNISIEKGERIHTENSHKFTPGDIKMFARYANLKCVKTYSDPNQWFSLVYYEK